MRKIQSQEEAERRKKRNIFIMSIFMLGVLVLSTLGYALLYSGGDSSGSSNKNNNIQQGPTQDGRWSAVVNGIQLIFTNSPETVKEISVSLTSSVNSYAGSTLYISSDNTAATAEIASTLGRFAPRVQEACYGECEKDLPEKDCSENLIIFLDETESKVYQQENCIFIEGDLRAVDAFLYKLFGIN